MPTYEYQCGTCKYKFEKYQSFTADPVKDCPECGHEVRKLFSAAGIIFKGSGWYKTEGRKPAEAEKKTEVKTEADAGEKKVEVPTAEVKAETAKTEGKTESRSEAKTESETKNKKDVSKENSPKKGTKEAAA